MSAAREIIIDWVRRAISARRICRGRWSWRARTPDGRAWRRFIAALLMQGDCMALRFRVAEEAFPGGRRKLETLGPPPAQD